MTKKVLISLEDIIALRRKCLGDMDGLQSKAGVVALNMEYEEWFDDQPDASKMEKIIAAYQQATDISIEELDIGDEDDN